jgi:hypothetical protein
MTQPGQSTQSTSQQATNQAPEAVTPPPEPLSAHEESRARKRAIEKRYRDRRKLEAKNETVGPDLQRLAGREIEDPQERAAAAAMKVVRARELHRQSEGRRRARLRAQRSTHREIDRFFDWSVIDHSNEQPGPQAQQPPDNIDDFFDWSASAEAYAAQSSGATTGSVTKEERIAAKVTERKVVERGNGGQEHSSGGLGM